jgi:hypothetical protein
LRPILQTASLGRALQSRSRRGPLAALARSYTARLWAWKGAISDVGAVFLGTSCSGIQSQVEGFAHFLRGRLVPLLRSLLLLVALASPALGQDGSSITAGAEAAANQMQIYLDGVAKAGGRPDFSKPPASDAFGQVFNLKELAALPPAKASDTGWLPQWLGVTNGVAKSILFFGVTLSNPPTADQVAAVKRNASDYEDEDAISVDFMIRLSARVAQSLTLFMNQLTPDQRTPIRQEGLERSQKGGAETIYSALLTIAQGMKPNNARLLSGAMSDTRDVWASFIPPQYRSQIMSQVATTQNAAKDNKLQDDLATLGATLAAAK